MPPVILLHDGAPLPLCALQVAAFTLCNRSRQDISEEPRVAFVLHHGFRTTQTARVQTLAIQIRRFCLLSQLVDNVEIIAVQSARFHD